MVSRRRESEENFRGCARLDELLGVSAFDLYFAPGGFCEFSAKGGGSDKSEYLIPNAVGGWITQGRAKVKVLPTAAKWAGMTYPEDKQLVAAYLRGLVGQGVYPDPLF